MSFGKRKAAEFNSALSRKEAIAVLCYLPVHCFILPRILSLFYMHGVMEEAWANLLLYVIGGIYMTAVAWRFLRREFAPFIDNIMHCILQICLSYGLMLVMNMVVNSMLLKLTALDNPNNMAIMDVAAVEYGKMAIMAVFLAPLVEELLFRAGIFGLLRTKSHLLAYAVSILAFAVYHVWPYAIHEPQNWIFIVQYIPPSYLLCRCYEKCGSIWGNILLHMVINGISLKAMTMLQELL